MLGIGGFVTEAGGSPSPYTPEDFEAAAREGEQLWLVATTVGRALTAEDPFLGGRKRYISFAPVTNCGWSIFIGRDSRAILLSESSFYIQMMATSLLLILLISFSLIYFRKQVIAQAAIEQLYAEKELQASVTRYEELAVIKIAADEVSEYAESIINTVREPLIALDQDLRVVTVSRSFYDFFKVNPEETVGQLIYDLGNKQWDIPKLRELLETILPQKATFDNYEVEHDFATIGRRTMLLNARQIQRVLGKERIILLAIEDITDRKRAEEKIKASLLEKETMLKEIHHRVKNNLQVISSLLALQSSYLQDEKAKEMFQNSMDRVMTMANIHTMLYQSKNLSMVDFGGFIRDLAGRLQQSYGIAGLPVGIHVNVSDVSLTIETSIPCGLILNELVSNALKHAFPEGRGGEVNISMTTAGDRFVLTVQDNGIGFPEAVDFQNTKSLGLELVNLLVGQMNGAITLTVEGGATFTITFPAVSKGG
jgi:PAS domain S-box-containing protein